MRGPTVADRLRRATGSTVSHDLSPWVGLVERAAAAETELRDADDAELLARAAAAAGRVRETGLDDPVLVEVTALAREAARRALGLRLYDEQVLAGIALARRTVVQMQTGEGKTLAAVAPAAVGGMTGRGVHVLTVNDYLARRDAAWMGPVYARLGLTVGAIQEGMTGEERRAAYACDVTYATAKEVGFDLLRDHLRLDASELVLRPFHSAIVDEADSILIDEARIPLVIAGDLEGSAVKLERLAELAEELEPGDDFDTDEHGRNINLTEKGSRRVEAVLGCGNLFAEDNLELLHRLRNALHALILLHRDVDYIVRHGRIEVVDELTGRVVEDRQWPDGLQAALEVKEGLRRQDEGTILGSVTVQHFVGSYPHLAGMTATAEPAASELAEMYGLSVTVVPTHRPCIRTDHEDLVFTHREAKRRAVVAEVADAHRQGRPVLVGTASVAESEELASELAAAGIPCRVLNARYDEAEAEIVAEAGAAGAVTISTNMAGRGTDIRLGGRDETERDHVVALGGLYVIGTNRHESRRIDDQLRGRAGRQGDPGASRFFTSLEDDLMVRFGLRELVPARCWPESQGDPVDSGVLRREMRRAQRIVDGQNMSARRLLWRYAQVVEGQRQYIQGWRQTVLRGSEPLDLLARERGERWLACCELAGGDTMAEVERRLTLLATDRCWCDHLAELQRVRDGIHLVTLGGKDAYEEFHAAARACFDQLLERLDREVLALFDRVVVTEDGVDWEAEGLLGPSSTWTYLVTDTPFRTGPLGAMAARQSSGIYLALAYAPLWICWMVWRWVRRVVGGVRVPG